MLKHRAFGELNNIILHVIGNIKYKQMYYSLLYDDKTRNYAYQYVV